MDMLAQADQLATLLRISSPTAAQADEMELALRLATGKIQNYTRQHLFFVEDEEVVVRGNWSDTLWLPQRPVTDVSLVKIDGLTIAASLYSWTPDGSVLLWVNDRTVVNAPSGYVGFWGGPGAVVRITNSHGYAEIPADLEAVCLSMAARQVGNVDPSGNTQARTIASYTEQFSRSASLDWSDDEKVVLDNYRRRAGYRNVSAV